MKGIFPFFWTQKIDPFFQTTLESIKINKLIKLKTFSVK